MLCFNDILSRGSMAQLILLYYKTTFMQTPEQKRQEIADHGYATPDQKPEQKMSGNEQSGQSLQAEDEEEETAADLGDGSDGGAASDGED